MAGAVGHQEAACSNGAFLLKSSLSWSFERGVILVEMAIDAR